MEFTNYFEKDGKKYHAIATERGKVTLLLCRVNATQSRTWKKDRALVSTALHYINGRLRRITDSYGGETAFLNMLDYYGHYEYRVIPYYNWPEYEIIREIQNKLDKTAKTTGKTDK